MSGYAFHAAAPSGEWLNDPNGLAYVDGRYLLYAQHSMDGPSGGDVGWGTFASDDMLGWTWEGVAIAPAASGSAYSGSLVMGDGLEAWFTRHDPVAGEQWQHRVGLDEGASECRLPIAPARNRRDPFVWHDAGTRAWRMLLAEPCDWTAWRETAPSRLSLWSSPDGDAWRCDDTIGPWHPPGVMYEVPVLLDLGETQALIVSLVDRRADTAMCSVRYWLGRVTNDGWSALPGFAHDGMPLDYGPDFYAAIASLPANWPLATPVVVAWASNWRDARNRSWPGGTRGGPISMARSVTLDEAHERLRLAPIAAASRLPSTAALFEDRLDMPGVTLAADRAGGTLTVNDGAPQPLDWLGSSSRCTVFRDANLVELFIAPEGATVTLAL